MRAAYTLPAPGAARSHPQPSADLVLPTTKPDLWSAPTGSARSLLLTILGELVYPNGAPVWSASLLQVMGDLGIEEKTARQAIARGARTGWLIREKHSRHVRWRLSSAAKRFIEDGIARVDSLCVQPEQWTGDWLILLITIPSSRSVVRKPLYSALSWAGFGYPAPGVWLSPHRERYAEAAQIVGKFELDDTTLAFSGPSLPFGLRQDQIVANGWGQLSEVAATYQHILDRYSQADASGSELDLLTHIELVNQLQRLPFLDPQLPQELLPDWIGRRAATLIQRCRADWFEQAQAQWDDVVRRTTPA